MVRENKQKIKLLKLMEILRQETDEQHPLRTSQICSRLSDLGIPCERRTLGMDMTALNSQGYEVMSTMLGHEKAYYIADRSFSVPEIRILMDAVQAANFITPGKSAELMDKLAALGGSHQAEILKSNLVCFNTRKHTNEKIYYNVQTLGDALQRNSKASFLYFDLNERKEKVYRKDGARYVVDPMALVYNEDNYYLMCYSQKHSAVVTFRVDRMESVLAENEAVCDEAIVNGADIHDYTGQVFKMYNGDATEVTLEFNRSLLGVVFDKFGEKISVSPCDDGSFRTRVSVQISPTFWGWLFQFGEQMKIVEPVTLHDEYSNMLTSCKEAQ